ncbi:MAG: molybdopterin molybdotransferase MoeA [Rhodobacteraceae bacterium]|nr:molybdopterin molybdotransferase MoeA [Paracoccaceae bacterium]
MISVAEARQRILALLEVTEAENVPLKDATWRVLARNIVATHSHPQSAISSMDGYAVRGADALPGALLQLVGEVPAGSTYAGPSLEAGTTVRVFTGAALPQGTDRVVIQEQVCQEGTTVTLGAELEASRFIREAGCDFKPGFELTAPRKLDPASISLAAAMNFASVPVRRRPDVAIIPNGDELVYPGDDLSPGKLVASNIYGLKAIVEQAGAIARLMPIARDRKSSIRNVLEMAATADLVVTIGGASVGDYDLIESMAFEFGYERSFHKIAMRPGKPLMAGRLRSTPHVGLPGNPVSALVCGYVFLVPAVAAMLGRENGGLRMGHAQLEKSLGANGPREHYMRARVSVTDGKSSIRVFRRQDSSLLSVMSSANALAVRPPHDPARDPGETMNFIGFQGFVQ